jgi:hypothetical protein
MDDKVLLKVRSLNYVHWIGHYDPEYRVSSNVLERAKAPLRVKNPKRVLSKIDNTFTIPTSPKTDIPSGTKRVPVVPYKYSVTFFTKKNFEQAKASLQRAGARIITSLPEDKRFIIDTQKIKKDPAEFLSKISQIHGVKRIDDIKIRKV